MPLDPRLDAILSTLPSDVDRSVPPAERRRAGRARRSSTEGLFATSVSPVADEYDLFVPADGGVRVRFYRPRPGVLPCLIYIHGGGWWQGDLDDSDASCRRRAEDADCVVASIEYRLAPEHPFPAGLDDCWTAVRHVAEHAPELQIDPSRLVISGGSAGGNLAAAVTLLARDHGGPSFRAQLLEVPATDLTLSQASIEEFGVGYGLTKADIEECVAFYIGERDAADPLISPLFADLAGLPRALVMTCECDPVRDDGEVYAAKLGAAGVETMLRRWDGIGHGCGEIDVLLPEIAAAYRATVAGFLRDVFQAVNV